MSRRIPALIVLLAAVVAGGLIWRDSPEAERAVFTEVQQAWMPSATFDSAQVGNWVCPGVPATGEPGIGGEVIISNPGPDPVTARLTWVVPATALDPLPIAELVEVAPYSVRRLDVGSRHRGLFVAAVVAVDRSDVIVEQQAFHPAGNPVSACSDSTSTEWFLAEGLTLGGSVNRVLITNPSEDLAIVNVGFATADGARLPSAYQGLPIAAQSMRVLDLGVAGGGAQGESRLAISIEATRGHVVVGRAQHQLDGGRLGYTLSLAAPSAQDQWWFAGGIKAPEVTERFMVYNPTSSPVEVDVIFLGIGDVQPITALQVPARQVVVFDPGPLSTLAEGRHAAVFSTSGGASIVVERILTKVEGARPVTSVVLGASPRWDGYVANVWRSAATPSEATDEAFVIYNVDNSSGVINVEYLSPQGPLPVPGMSDIELGPAAILTLDLTYERAFGAEVIISSSTRILVERNYLSGFESGRSASWALPVR
jgi:hypothetical protein